MVEKYKLATYVSNFLKCSPQHKPAFVLSSCEAARGHATYVDSKILDATTDFKTSNENCVDELSSRSFRDLTKNRGYHGPSQRCQVPISILNKIEVNCQLPFTLPSNEEDRDQVSFWHTFFYQRLA